MNRFSTERDAKECLVSKIVEEAQREGVALSEVERKMLYFSETGWTLPDIMEVNDEFDREYDQNAYESKINKLSNEIVKRIRKEQPEEYEAWKEAVRRLSRGDHYLLVMVGQAGGRPPMDPWKAYGIGFAIAVAFFGVVVISVAYNIDLGKYLPSRDFLRFAFWAALVFAAVSYVLLRLVFGGQRIGDITNRLLEWMFGRSKWGD
ncbi:MAG TPA: hypothetical protein VF860_08290 [Candidatus Acidoferrales bacterium]